MRACSESASGGPHAVDEAEKSPHEGVHAVAHVSRCRIRLSTATCAVPLHACTPCASAKPSARSRRWHASSRYSPSTCPGAVDDEADQVCCR